MRNKKIIFIILTIFVILICFIVSFMIGNQILNISGNNKIENGKLNQEKNKYEEENASEIEQKYINKIGKDNFFEGKIISINEKSIGVENSSHLVDYSIYEGDMKWHNEHLVTKNGRLYVTASYILEIDNVPIKNNNGNKINISELKVGDNISVFTKNVKYAVNTIFTPITSEYIDVIVKK